MEIYVDGACTANNAVGRANKALRHAAYGIFSSSSSREIEEGGHVPREVLELPGCAGATNQVAELYAFTRALEIISKIEKNDRRGSVTIKSDSLYTVNVFTKWAAGWERRGWKRAAFKGGSTDIVNLALIQRGCALLRDLSASGTRVSIRHVRAHRSEPPNRMCEEWRDWYGNMRADRLANGAAVGAAKEAMAHRDGALGIRPQAGA